MLFKPQEKSITEQLSLKGKVALVTGGSRGIGLAAAKGLAEAGASVAITYITAGPEKLAEVEKAVKAAGTDTFKAYKADVKSKESIEAVVDQVVSDFGRLDIVVPNAGVAIHVAAEDFTQKDYEEQMRTNLDGAFYTAQAASRVFKAQKEQGTLDQGRIVFTASVSSFIVNYPQKQAPYNASKAGLVQMAKCLAVEWIDFARVNCISPGYTATDMIDAKPKEWRDTWDSLIPAKRDCELYEIKGAYVFLASDASSYITGHEMVIAGGFTLT